MGRSAKVQIRIFCIAAVLIAGFVSNHSYFDLPGSRADESNTYDANTAAELSFLDVSESTPSESVQSAESETIKGQTGQLFSAPSLRIRANASGLEERMFFALDDSQPTQAGFDAANSLHLIPISLAIAGVYWVSYADYLARTLSVDVDVSNQGSDTFYEVALTDGNSTNGVTFISSFPAEVGDIPSGENRTVALAFKYFVPSGVTSFRSSLTGSAKDVLGVPHTFINGLVSPTSSYGTPRVIARFIGTLDCDYPAGLSFDTEGPAEDRPVTQDGVSLFGYFHEPEADIENPRALPYVFLREDDANGFDHTQAWWMAMEIELGYGYDDVSPCITFDWFNITTPNGTRTGTVNNEGFLLDYYSKTGVLSSKKIGFWRIPMDQMGDVKIAMPEDFAAGDIYRMIVSWSPDAGLAFHLTPVSAGLPMLSGYDSSSLAKIPIVAENPYITISGSIAWDGMGPSQRSYQDNSRHRNFILANGEISDSAINEYMANPAIFITGILKV